MPVTGTKVGVADNAAGAGVQEILTLLSTGLGGLVQAMASLPMGDPWQIRAAASHTPTLISDTFPPHPLMAYKVPNDKSLLFTGGEYHCLAAATDHVRVCRRYFMYGYQATAAPAAPAAPTLALIALTEGIGTSGAYSYKVAALDAFRREGPLSAASASVTLTAANQGISVAPPAVPTGATGFNIYRTLAGGSTYYFVGTVTGSSAVRDALPDANVDTVLTPSATWSVGAIVGEIVDGPCEIIIETGPQALTGSPAWLVVQGDMRRIANSITYTGTVGQRLRMKPGWENVNFVPTPTFTGNLWRGPFTSDKRTGPDEEFGIKAVIGTDVNPTAGSFMVWGQQIIGHTERNEAAAAIKAITIRPVHPHGALLPPNSEIVCEIGALALGVAAVRDISLSGLLLPATAT